ncbi:hypothetical protein AWB76_06984 [Caballeronia temeraria]|uniref:Uncharacterized protein n=1 Tax=Caballeronia temeraria TaxID=1777137 RepID=A0A158DHM2_9BURK|nr:hypothetical protein AWB76_06984 [Caballeronia temeraria]
MMRFLDSHPTKQGHEPTDTDSNRKPHDVVKRSSIASPSGVEVGFLKRCSVRAIEVKF